MSKGGAALEFSASESHSFVFGQRRMLCAKFYLEIGHSLLDIGYYLGYSKLPIFPP